MPWADTPRRPPHPRPDLSSLTPMSNHTLTASGRHLNRFREADGRTIVPGWNTSRPELCAHGASRTPSPARVCVRIYLQVSPYLLSTNGLQGGGCPFSFKVCSKSQFALTVKNLTCFQGFDLRIAVFGKFGFWYIYLEQKNIKTLIFSALKQPKTILKQDAYRPNLQQNDKIVAMSRP